MHDNSMQDKSMDLPSQLTDVQKARGVEGSATTLAEHLLARGRRPIALAGPGGEIGFEGAERSLLDCACPHACAVGSIIQKSYAYIAKRIQLRAFR
jgi:hypothetical protein